MKIKVGKSRYTVTFPDGVEPSCIVHGRVNYVDKTIQIAQRAGWPLRKISDKQQDATLWHELTHAILKDMGSRKAADEVFVDELSKRMQQVAEQLLHG